MDNYKTLMFTPQTTAGMANKFYSYNIKEQGDDPDKRIEFFVHFLSQVGTEGTKIVIFSRNITFSIMEDFIIGVSFVDG